MTITDAQLQQLIQSVFDNDRADHLLQELLDDLPALLDRLETLLARAEDVQRMRAEKGRQLSPSSRFKLLALQWDLTDLRNLLAVAG